MLTDAEPFLQRVRAFPDDDVPRLIFADWLEEQGAAGAQRAAFIRVQVALARLTAEDPQRPNLAAAEAALLEAHRDEWEAPFRRLASGPVFRRGFVDEVNVTARQFLQHVHELFAAGPIRRLHLLEVGSYLPAIMESSYLSRLSSLSLFALHGGDSVARAVARATQLTGLRELHLGRNRLGDEAAELLATASGLGSLEELDLSENDISESGARAVAASRHLGQVKRLELRHNQIGPAGAEAIAASDRLASLQRLGLAGNGLGITRLFSLPRVSSLLSVPCLDLTANSLSPGALKAILTRPLGDSAPIRLRELDLSHNDLGEPGIRVLAQAAALEDLKVLRLAGCGIPDEGLRLLALSPHLNRLVSLDVSNNPVSDQGFRTFHDTPFLRSLRRVVTPGIGVTPRMRQALDRRYHGGTIRS
jgi:uncharacterized protein (TIGR02996 family)